jgi:hypothetical protein
METPKSQTPAPQQHPADAPATQFPATVYTPIGAAPFYLERVVADEAGLKALGKDVFKTPEDALAYGDTQAPPEYPLTVYTPLETPPFFTKHIVNNEDELKALAPPNVFATAEDALAYRDAEALPFPWIRRSDNMEQFDPRKSQPGRNIVTPVVPMPTHNIYVKQGDPSAPAGELKPPAEPPANPNAPPHATPADPHAPNPNPHP